MILQLMEIPVFYGNKLLDKLRYLQLELRQRCSVIHWRYDFLPEALVSRYVKFYVDFQHFWFVRYVIISITGLELCSYL
jgi:hypothetical protein